MRAGYVNGVGCEITMGRGEGRIEAGGMEFEHGDGVAYVSDRGEDGMNEVMKV